jgi:hypothetical protein
MSLQAFAAAEGMNWRTLQHWKYVLGKEGGGGAGARGDDDGSRELSFVELRPATVTTDGRFEVEVGDGRRVRVPPSFDVEALRRLLGVLEGRS